MAMWFYILIIFVLTTVATIITNTFKGDKVYEVTTGLYYIILAILAFDFFWTKFILNFITSLQGTT